MPKIRDSRQKPDIFEITTTHTQQGSRVAHVPVKDSQPSPSPSHSASPSKKRAWSPGVLIADDDYNVSTDQIPKCPKTVGKVHMNILCNCAMIKSLWRLRISFSKSILVDDIVFWSNFSDTNPCLRGCPAQIANNCPEHIDVRIASVSTFCVVPAVFPLKQLSRSIAFKCGMDVSSSSLISSHMIWHWISYIIQIIVHPFRSTQTASLTKRYPMKLMSLRRTPNQHRILDHDQISPSFHLPVSSNVLSDGAIAPNPRINTFNFSFVRDFSQQVLKTQRQYLHSRFWIISWLIH